MGRLLENSVVNIKNKSHAVTAEILEIREYARTAPGGAHLATMRGPDPFECVRAYRVLLTLMKYVAPGSGKPSVAWYCTLNKLATPACTANPLPSVCVTVSEVSQ